MKLSAKNKIVVIGIFWAGVCVLMVSYLFKFLQQSNEQVLAQIKDQQKELLVLQAEKESYDLAQKDLAELGKRTVQPEDFFSQDVTLVNEIKTLEELGNRLNVNLNLSGLSGVVKNAPKAPTKGQIFAVPYSISLSGSFNNVIKFLETLEHLDFITLITGLNVSATSGGNVSASLTANFYLRQR